MNPIIECQINLKICGLSKEGYIEMTKEEIEALKNRVEAMKENSCCSCVGCDHDNGKGVHRWCFEHHPFSNPCVCKSLKPGQITECKIGTDGWPICFRCSEPINPMRHYTKVTFNTKAQDASPS